MSRGVMALVGEYHVENGAVDTGADNFVILIHEHNVVDSDDGSFALSFCGYM